MLNRFAEEIKNIRLSKELSLQQVSIKTRIDLKFLEAMEAGDFEFLPEIYVKSFLKEYLKALDADQNIFLKKYELAKQGKVYDEEVKPEEKKEDIKLKQTPKLPETPVEKIPPKASPEIPAFDAVRQYNRREYESAASKKKRLKILYYISAAAVFIAAVLYVFLFNGEEDLIVPEKPWEEVIEQNDSGNEDETAEALVYDSAAVSDSLLLTIKASDTSWMKITFDDLKTDEFILFPGSQKSLKAADNYKIIFGNARGVLLDLNGSPLQLKSGSSVQRVKIDSNGLSEFESSTIKNE